MADRPLDPKLVYIKSKIAITCLLLALDFCLNIAHADSEAQIEVRAVVVATASLKTLYQQPDFVVTDLDISKGYIDVNGATRIEVRNNHPRGYFLVFEVLKGAIDNIRNISLQGLGRDIQIETNGAWILMPYKGLGPATLDISYIFTLDKNARPGRYAWPMSLSIQPFDSY